jgi:hypothetical protein
MAMTSTHVREIFTADREHDGSTLDLILALGAGAVDPALIEPQDTQEHQDVEELIAFRCSAL